VMDGMFCKNLGSKPVDGWRYSSVDTGWRAVGFITRKGATGSRPALAAADVGCPYLDTTLDADGKPIWWAGAAWVDATGAVV